MQDQEQLVLPLPELPKRVDLAALSSQLAINPLNASLSKEFVRAATNNAVCDLNDNQLASYRSHIASVISFYGDKLRDQVHGVGEERETLLASIPLQDPPSAWYIAFQPSLQDGKPYDIDGDGKAEGNFYAIYTPYPLMDPLPLPVPPVARPVGHVAAAPVIDGASFRGVLRGDTVKPGTIVDIDGDGGKWRRLARTFLAEKWPDEEGNWHYGGFYVRVM